MMKELGFNQNSVEKNIVEKVYIIDIIWSLYPIILLIILSGFDKSNFINTIKIPFNILMNLKI